MTKTKAAFLLSVESLFNMGRRVYMWTFTFRTVVDDEIAFKSWNHLNTLLSREFGAKGGMPGLRVVEVHKGGQNWLFPDLGGHGLHFHALIARRLPIEVVRRLAIRAGFGRIHVQKCKVSAAKYLAKYLGKQDDGLRRGARRWGMMGGFKGTRVKDIVVESTLAENCRRVRAVVRSWSYGLFVEVNKLTAKYGHCLDWPEFPALAQLKFDFVRSDNDYELPWGCDRHGNKVRFSSVNVYDSELGYYVKVLVRTSRMDDPFFLTEENNAN